MPTRRETRCRYAKSLSDFSSLSDAEVGSMRRVIRPKLAKTGNQFGEIEIPFQVEKRPNY